MFGGFFGQGQNANYEGHDGRGNNQVGSNIGRGNADPRNTFMRSFQCFSPAFIGKQNINRGNKIILPASALNELSRMKISYPMTFMIMNPELSIRTYCGVLEFDAEENSCNIPLWMMNNLCVGEGSEVIVRSVNLKKGSFVKIRPHETKFIELSNPKAVLE